MNLGGSSTIVVRSQPNVDVFGLGSFSGVFKIEDTSDSYKSLLDHFIKLPRRDFHFLTIKINIDPSISLDIMPTIEESEFNIIEIEELLESEILENNINAIPIKINTYKRIPKEHSYQDCPICQCKFKFKEGFRKLPCECKYIFHKKCIDKWFKRELSCPTCKQSFSVT